MSPDFTDTARRYLMGAVAPPGWKQPSRATLAGGLRLAWDPTSRYQVRLYWRGDTACIDWHEGGNRYRRSLGRLAPRAAEKVRAQKEAELTHGVKIIARDQTVDQYLEWYLDWSRPSTPR